MGSNYTCKTKIENTTTFAVQVEVVLESFLEELMLFAELRLDVVPVAAAFLLSDELVALPSSLSDAESAAAAAGVTTAGAAAAALGSSLRLRISGLSETVLILSLPSSITEVVRRPLSELSNSSPE